MNGPNNAMTCADLYRLACEMRTIACQLTYTDPFTGDTRPSVFHLNELANQVAVLAEHLAIMGVAQDGRDRK